MAGSRYIYGKNSVKALLDTHPEKVFKIFLAEGLKPDKRLQSIQENTRNHGIPVQMVPRPKLDQMLRSQEDNQPTKPRPEQDSEPDTAYDAPIHQGVVASVAPKALLELSVLIKQCKAKIEQGQHPRLLLLDSITDPRNFGAILRVADAAGVSGVVIPKHHSAGFGPAVTKTASGAEETVDIAVVANLNNAIRDLKEAGFWIAGAANDPGAVDYHKQDYKMPIALVMGSEDKGLASLIRKNCDFLLEIPMHGTVESLNVATATAVLLFEMVKP
jgi:23S rRNA (guanosine2251-2'-O)-methyltransferase